MIVLYTIGLAFSMALTFTSIKSVIFEKEWPKCIAGCIVGLYFAGTALLYLYKVAGK